MLRFLAFLLLFTLVLDDAKAQPIAPPENEASTVTPIERRARQLVAVINNEADPQDVFTTAFLAALPPEQFAAISRQITDQFGAAISVESVTPRDGSSGTLVLRMERAIATGPLVIDPNQENRIAGVRLVSFEPFGDNPAKIKADIEALPGTLSAYFGPVEGAPGIIAINPDVQMPLGSTMKLYVLAQLGREIAQGKRAWSDVITLDQKSFPSGQMQNWPDGAPVTLHSLASMMISISDNTATDQLIRELGQDAMQSILADTAHFEARRNSPWMTTREMFLLKAGNRDRLAAYARAAPDVRAQILADLETRPASAAEVERAFAGGPRALDIEWFASTSDLAQLFQVMLAQCDAETLRIMAINPNAAPMAAGNWEYIGYKGGSEPGVLNLTWLLRDKAGRARMLALSWANSEAAVDETTLNLIGQRILSLPH